MSPEAQAIYEILIHSLKPLTAKQIGQKLTIVPNTVYRLTRELIRLGLITSSGKYPSLFTALSVDNGLSLYLLHQQNWFSKTFGATTQSTMKNQIALSFVQSRDELMRVSIDETEKTKKSIDLLRSGHEIPSDLMFALIKSHKRGVVTRMLIQDYGPENKEMVSYWKRNGFLVRKTDLRHIRLMIYDANVIYFMSYKHTAKELDMGMKIEYAPLASIFSPLFNAWWKNAEII